jgi:hypothetical protein
MQKNGTIRQQVVGVTEASTPIISASMLKAILSDVELGWSVINKCDVELCDVEKNQYRVELLYTIGPKS